jgi:hypothetical protein
MSGPDPKTTCVVLVREGAALGDAARRALAERDWQLVVRHHPVATMAELCLRHRRSSAVPSGRAGETVTVLLVHDLARWPEAARLVEASRRYLPAVSVLCTDEQDAVREVHVGPARVDEPPPAAPPPVEDGADDAAGRAPREATDGRETDLDDDAMRITRAEIEMLLQAQPGES